MSLQRSACRVTLRKFVTITVVTFVSLTTAHAAQSQNETATQLTPGKTLQRELGGADVHTFRIDAESGNSVNVVVQQMGVDLVVTLTGPDNRELQEVDSPNGDRGPEPVRFIAGVAGVYTITVKPTSELAAIGKYDIVLKELRAATAVDRQSVEAHKLFLEGMELANKRASDEAKKKFQSAIDLWHSLGDAEAELDLLENLGQLYSSATDRQVPTKYLEQALELARTKHDRHHEGYILCLIGDLHITSTVEEKQKSFAFYNQALGISREIGDRWTEAFALTQLGLVYASLSETKKAFDYFLPVLEVFRALGDKQGELETLNYIGGLYSWLGDNQKAIDHYIQALPLADAIRDRQNEYYTLSNIGSSVYYLGDYERALNYFERARKLSSRDPEMNGTTLNNVAAIYHKLGQYEKARDLFEEALVVWRDLKNKREEGSTLNNLGVVYKDMGDVDHAVTLYKEALPLKQYVGDRRGEVSILLNLAQVQLDREALAALDSYRKAFELSAVVNDQEREAQALDGMSRAHVKLGNLWEAYSNSQASLKIVESARARIASRQVRATYYASVQTYYSHYIHVLMQLHKQDPEKGWDRQAFQASEHTRARALLESLEEANIDIRRGVDQSLLDRERQLQQQLGARAELEVRSADKKRTEAEAAAFKLETDELVAAYQEVQDRIRASHPDFASLTQTREININQFQKEFLDADTVFLEFSLGEEASYLWTITDRSFQSYVLPKRQPIQKAARRVYELLTARERPVKFETAVERNARITKADKEYVAAARELSDLVLAPVAGKLGNSRLIISGDGALNYVPFAALPVSSAKGFVPLVSEHEIINSPSALSLTLQHRQLAGRAHAPKLFAVFADPVFDKNDERVNAGMGRTVAISSRSTDESATRSTSSGLQAALRDTDAAVATLIRRLPFTRREADQIAALVPASKKKEALDFAANRATATNGDLRDYRFVHFATHGFINTMHPELSGIVLSLVDQNGMDQDGFLRSYEIYNLKLTADMVVLSGCRTGLGKELRGEGLIGLTRGFMYAGAARVLVSLWNISDEASAELMTTTYRGMLGREKLRPSAALRNAQLSIRKQKRWQAPYYWAAFVLEGEPN